MKVAFVYIGILENSSRLLKQIETLKELDVKVDVYLGNENYTLQNYSKYNFTVYEFSIVHGGFFKIKSLLNPLFFCYKVFREIKKQSYDFVICQELTTFLTGFYIKKNLKNTKVIFDNNELSVERYSDLKKIIWTFFQKILLSSADIIIHSEQNRLEYFIKKHNLDRQSQKLVCNYPVSHKIHTSKKTQKVRVIYLGVIHPNRQIEELIDAFVNLDEDLSLDLVGAGDKSYIELIRTKIKANNNIKLLPFVPQSAINELLSNYTIGIAFYSNSNLNNYFCAPNKVFQYINNKLAIITNDYPGLLDIVQENKIGVCLKEVNEESLRFGVNKILTKKLHLNISDKIRKKYQWRTQKEVFLSIFK